MISALLSFFDLTVSVVQSIIRTLGYIPLLFRWISLGANQFLTLFNQLPTWLFALGGITVFISVIFLIFGR